MRLRSLFSVIVVALLAGTGEAGVAYYSGFDSTNGGAVVFDITESTTNPLWKPIAGQGSVGLRGADDSSGSFILDGTNDSGTAGSANPFSVYMSTFGTQLLVNSSASGPSETSSLETISISLPDFNWDADAESASQTAGIADTSFGTSRNVSGYSTTPGDNNYFSWAAFNGTSLYAIGWARVDAQDATFTIIDWAYNLASTTSTIQFGETGADPNSNNNNGAVPEPTGLAIFGLVLAGAAAARRRRN